MSSDRNVVIIGSGPAGLTAALYTARANLQPLVIEGVEAGGQLMITTLVENWPGYRDGIMGPALMAEMRAQAERFGAEMIQSHVTAVDFGSVPFTVRTTEAVYKARSVIVATGASAKLLGLPSERILDAADIISAALQGFRVPRHGQQVREAAAVQARPCEMFRYEFRLEAIDQPLKRGEMVAVGILVAGQGQPDSVQ